MNNNRVINIIGAGLAGSECAFQLAKAGIKVNLYDMKPSRFSPAHSNPNFAELVCSNSLKSNDITNACGLLKEELRLLKSMVIEVADRVKVPAGMSLSVDRNKFAQEITEILKSNTNITFISQYVEDVDRDGITVIATGPLTDGKLSESLSAIIGTQHLYFFDAASPIVTKGSLISGKYFIANRYNKGEGEGDYINCPMSQEEYQTFYNQLISAETVKLKDFEDKKVFEGCMPVEVMAKRGYKTLLFGPLKPKGLFDSVNNVKPYAVMQLRREAVTDELYNLVGFQTNLTFSEQKRVFSLIPALKNAEFVRYGVMHKNTYINAPICLNGFYQLKNNENIYIAGQLSGVEGYVESVASGLNVALNIIDRLNGKKIEQFSNKTAIGSLINFITKASPDNFQPINANWGIIDTKTSGADRQKSAETALDEIKKYTDKTLTKIIL